MACYSPWGQMSWIQLSNWRITSIVSSWTILNCMHRHIYFTTSLEVTKGKMFSRWTWPHCGVCGVGGWRGGAFWQKKIELRPIFGNAKENKNKNHFFSNHFEVSRTARTLSCCHYTLRYKVRSENTLLCMVLIKKTSDI